ncbi:MAG: FKBP-type peptidyl-prolyl cis-trans isomerase [Planctomycetes bacterium]|nr:FKBP-type peptidyl-prolyl cis-trans isomerase [Planctomycetota bacterium]
MIELEIPYELGYGTIGSAPTIPPKASLHFLVELIEVSDPPISAPVQTPHMHGPATPGEVDADAPEEFTTTPSGLKYRIRRKSDGKKPTMASTVTVHYRGWLDDGKEFDASYPRGETTEFALAGVIKGWTEGLQLIGTGGMIELDIPPELGYGSTGTSGIPPNSRLHFIVELINVK